MIVLGGRSAARDAIKKRDENEWQGVADVARCPRRCRGAPCGIEVHFFSAALLVPLSDLLELPRQVTVLAYQYGGVLCDMVTPTNGALMAAQHAVRNGPIQNTPSDLRTIGWFRRALHSRQ